MKTRPSARRTFADNLRKARLAAKLSQEDLAELADLHRTYVGSVERGERNLSIDNMERLAALRQRKNTRQPLDWNCIVADATVSGLVQYVRTGLALGVGNFNFLELLKHGSLETIGAANRLDHAYSLPPGPLAQARETLHAALRYCASARGKVNR